MPNHFLRHVAQVREVLPSPVVPKIQQRVQRVLSPSQGLLLDVGHLLVDEAFQLIDIHPFFSISKKSKELGICVNDSAAGGESCSFSGGLPALEHTPGVTACLKITRIAQSAFLDKLTNGFGCLTHMVVRRWHIWDGASGRVRSSRP